MSKSMKQYLLTIFYMGEIMSLEKIGLDYLRECFKYDIDSGELYWREDRPLSHFSHPNTGKYWLEKYGGKVAGSVGKIRCTSYRILKIKGFGTTNHRVIWFMYYGDLPEVIDHVDGDGLNNRISNLRASSLKDNPKNQKLHKRNTSGVSGVSYLKKYGAWRVMIGSGKDTIHFGTYYDFFEACCKRFSEANKRGYGTRDRLSE